MKKGIIIFVFISIFIAAIILARFTGFAVTSTNSCIDTDGGKNYISRGMVEGIYYLLTKEEFSQQDYCEDEKILVEYYCIQEDTNSYKKSVKYECEHGCKDGECF
jgi:hypothetical protein